MDYRNGYLYEYYCNPEGVKLYDSLKKESDFISQFEHTTVCKDSINQQHKNFYLRYNAYNVFFDFDNASTPFPVYFNLTRGNYFDNKTVGIFFLSSENYFLSPVECRAIKYENNGDINVVKEKIVTTIPSEYFVVDPIEIFENATTCDEQIANLWSLYELCVEWYELSQID